MEEFLNQNAEIAVLSLMVKHPEISEKLKDLKYYMFSSLTNKTLFESLKKMYEDSLTLDYGLVISVLKSKNLLASVGGESYLQYLYSQNFNTNNTEEFVRQVINSFKLRELISLYSSLPQSLSSSTDVDRVILSLKDELSKLDEIIVEEGVVDFNQATKYTYELLREQMNKSEKIEYSTNLKNLDGVTGGYWAGDVWIVAGRPGHGKSSFICNSLLNGVPSLLFSLEMPKETVTQRIIANYTGVPVFNIRMGLLSQKDIETIENGIKELKDLPIYIDAKYFISPEYISSTIRKYVKEKGVKLVYLDYIQLLVERSTTATHDIGRLTRDFKLMSNDLGVTSIIASQLNRLVELRDDKRPILSDLRQSGNLEEDADIALFLYRDELYNKNTKDKGQIELLLRKQRNGPQGVLFARFNELTNRFTEIN